MTRERGYSTVTEFADARPTVSGLKLAEELSGTTGDVSAVEVFRGLFEEAEANHTTKRRMRDLLARRLAETLPAG